MNNLKKINEAIERSISHNEIVHVEVVDIDISQIVADIIDYDVDYAKENDGSYDVWGWTEETPENTQEWRINISIK